MHIRLLNLLQIKKNQQLHAWSAISRGCLAIDPVMENSWIRRIGYIETTVAMLFDVAYSLIIYIANLCLVSVIYPCNRTSYRTVWRHRFDWSGCSTSLTRCRRLNWTVALFQYCGSSCHMTQGDRLNQLKLQRKHLKSATTGSMMYVTKSLTYFICCTNPILLYGAR